MDYYQQAAQLAKGIVTGENKFFERYIKNEIEDYQGDFILGILPNDADLLVLDMHSNGNTNEEREAEMEYTQRMLFDRDVPLFLHGTEGIVTEIDKLTAYEVFTEFKEKLLATPLAKNDTA